MNKIYKKVIAYSMALLIIFPVLAIASNANAQVNLEDTMWNSTGGKQNFIESTGFGSRSPVEIAIFLINLFMGFLGIIAVIIILIGGFKWMTAAGAEDKIEEAKKMIIAGIIGLSIILMAFGIAQYVISTVGGATM